MSTPLYVLIVEDSEPDAILVVRELQGSGYAPTFERVETPKAFSAALAGQAWDVIIADYTLPRFNGLDALRLLQETELDLPFIIISGTIGEEVAVATMRAGAHDYVMKDNLTRLGAAVRRELREAKVRLARKRAEEALRASRGYARNLIDSSLDMVVAVDMERRIVEFNRAAQETFGYHLDEVLGKHVDMLYADPCEGFMIHQATLEEGQCAREILNKRKNGQVFSCLLAASVLGDTRGEPTGVMGISRDITERKRAEEALRASEERYRALYDDNPSMYFTVDAEGIVLSVNQFGAKQLGYEVEELVGQPVLNVFYKDDKENVQQQFAACLQNPTQVARWEFRKVRKDGSLLWVKEAARVVQRVDGEWVVLIVCEEITERKRAEKIQTSLYRISEATNTVQNLDELFRSIHDIVGELMPVDNFYIALYDAATEMLSFPYFVDEYDDTPAPKKLEKGLTEYVLRTGQPLLASPQVFAELVEKGEAEQIGAPSIDWLGVPLKAHDKIIGALVVQSYTEGIRFREEDKNLLGFVSAQIAMAIERVRAEGERERLLAALQHRSAQLQTAAEVSRAASSILDPNELIQQVVDLIRERFGLYYAGLFLVDRTGEWTGEPGKWAVLRAGTGKAGQQMLEQGHKLEIGGASMIGWCVVNEQARITLDVGGDADAVRFENPLLPETRSELALPLVSRGHVTGALTIQSSQEAAFSEEDILVLQTMADKLANAIQNARLFEETRVRAERLALLNRVARAIGAPLRLDDLLDTVYREVLSLFQPDALFIALYDEETDELDARIRMDEGFREPPMRRSLGAGFTSLVVTERKPLLVRDYEQEKDRLPLPEQIEETRRSSSWLGVPMLISGQVIGVISVQSYRARAYGEEEQLLLTTIADEVAVAVENARLFEDARSRAERLALLNRIASAVGATLHLDDLLEKVYQEISSVFRTDAFFIALYDEETGELDFRLQVDEGIREPPRQELLGTGFTSFVVTEKKPLLVQDYEQEKDRLPSPVLFGTMKGPASWLGAPMLIGERVIGVISVQAYLSYAYGEEERLLLTTIADQMSMAVEKARLYEQAQQEIAERKRVEEALRESEERYRRLVEISPDGIVVHSGGKVVFINAVGMNLVGAESLDQIIGRPVMDFVHPDYRGIAAERIQQALRAGKLPPPIHEKFIRLDGTLLDVEVTGAPFVYQDKAAMLLVVRDIAERIRSEEALRESEERYRTLVTQAPIGVITCDREGNITHVNPALLQILDSPSEEATRQFNLLTMPNLVEAGIAADFCRCMEEATQITAEYRYRSYWGRDSILRLRMIPLRDESGTVSGILGTVEDVTQQRRLQEQLVHSAKLASIGELAAGVAHEINNPINGIINYAQLLLNKAEEGSRQARFLEGILREGDRVAAIVRDLLIFARVEKEAHSPASVLDILRVTLTLSGQQLKKDGVILEIQEQPNLPQIKCRSQRIQQVFLNLISNARDALNARYPGADPNKRLVIRIEEIEKEGQPHVRTTFHDRGEGIPAHNLARIFTPFFTTKRPDEGTGLGLSVSYGIVHDHHGDILVKSVEGESTIFRVDLPVDPGWA